VGEQRGIDGVHSTAEPLSLAAFERYEALELLPPGLLDRVRAR